jgi:hypothetical protein
LQASAGTSAQTDVRGELAVVFQDSYVLDQKREDLFALSVDDGGICPKQRQITAQGHDTLAHVIGKLILRFGSEASQLVLGRRELREPRIPFRLEPSRDQTIGRIDQHKTPPCGIVFVTRASNT